MKLTKSHIDSPITKTRKMVFLSILVSLSLIMFIVESMIPLPFMVPGIKLGLANIITVIALYIFDFFDALLVVVLRVVLATFFATSASTFLFSMSGALLSLFIMSFLKKVGRDNISIIGVSLSGAVFHNIGQIIVASFIVQNLNLFFYLPILMIAGILTGIFVGFAANFLLNHLKRLKIIW